ncbi:MAG: ABC transporter substrate-binding protein [Gammaproteobacteria bacterium]|nr:ABC transporter substrate-binding protein [Gammaproteobacteria bacterium]MBU6508573.1 ABC transporter substrate-binding protein [Gammaproteobacteria bacterium]MDE1983308.1 ABC transporter substrate-binding protein [Gammaproteobacteria bacterium]MDE2107871.1 ABC transporter substrate-binding protein [Gammaproteobacteria bacterium]MDE2461779.1 ABC transporter substrate-binding protein [Gammaproteobacteria bacterium]
MTRITRLQLGTFALSALLGLSVTAAAAGVGAAALPSPNQVVQRTAQEILSQVSSQRVELERDPQQLYALVGKDLLPHFDFDYASRLVLGPYWRSATPAQRKAFEDAFYRFLVNGYANGLLNGNYSERNLQVEPWRGSAEDTRAMVRTQVLRPNAPPVHVDYAMVRTKDGWKAFDVSVEGVSYVMNYRNQFAPEIQQKGLDALIARLNADAAKPPAKPGGS